MNITFLIGNGFDRNLGLATTYSDFVKVYKKTQATTSTLEKFREHIKDNEELWSAAEVALGQYTSQFEKGEAAAFAECQEDFCEHLSVYLKEQESRIDYTFSENRIKDAFMRMNGIIQSFPTQEFQILNRVYKNLENQIRLFNFICFNYTETLNKCLSVAEQYSEVLGSHSYGGKKMHHGIGNIIHVHGTVDKEMIFGINDEQQITKVEIFDCEDGDLYKNLLIKQLANASYLENTDGNANKLLQDSHIIYIYGMSIGETDKLWWDRICKWLNANNEHHLIIQKYDAPVKSVLPLKYQIFERKCKREFTQYCDLEQSQKSNIEKRIHITGENIFEEINNIAEDTIAKKAHAKVEKLLSMT